MSRSICEDIDSPLIRSNENSPVILEESSKFNHDFDQPEAVVVGSEGVVSFN
jgi:hypothetical protein